MFDIELMRRLGVIAEMGEAEREAVRGYREAFEAVDADRDALEAAGGEGADLGDAEIAALVSDAARLAVIGFEVSDKSYYERRLARPTWPKAASGITIGIGYDVGYHTAAEVRAHWAGLLAESAIARLCRVVALKGEAAAARVGELADIVVPWDAALEAFRRSTMPKYGRLALQAFPNALATRGHGFGALFSLVFNRGPSMTDRPAGSGNRREMRSIRDLVRNADYAGVPGQIRAMKRLWDSAQLAGLHKRREAEAALFERWLEQRPALVAAAGAPEGGELETAGAGAHRLEAVVDADAQHWDETGEEDRNLESAADWGRVRWSPDDASPDYAHLPDRTLKGRAFELDHRALEVLIAANHFAPTRAHGRIVFALRGAELVTSLENPAPVTRREDAERLVLRDRRPDHQHFGCVIGAWNVGTGRLSAYTASTVPNRRAVAIYHASRSTGNMMATGCYSFEVGMHNRTRPERRIPGCLIENGRQKAVLRSTNNLSYDLADRFENAPPHGDNLHPSLADVSAEFSSFGCLVVKGGYEVGAGDRERGTHTGEWARLRAALGLAPTGTRDHGKRFDVVLLTGLEAAVAASLVTERKDTDADLVQAKLGRLRQGSTGPRVAKLRRALGLSEGSVFDHKVAKALADRQRSDTGKGDGIYAPASDAHFGFGVFAPMEIVVAGTPAGGPLEAAGGDGEHLEAARVRREQRIAALEYEIGLYAEAAVRGGGVVDASELETLEAAHLESSFGYLREVGAGIVQNLELRLRRYICESRADGLYDPDEVRARVAELGRAGVERLRGYLVEILARTTVFVPAAVCEKVVDIVLEKLVYPSLAPAGQMVTDRIELSAQWLCQQWSAAEVPEAATLTAETRSEAAALVARLAAKLDEVPVNRAEAAPLIAELDERLADPRTPFEPETATKLLKALRGARMFPELARFADRLATRDSRMLGIASNAYAQGLVDSGQLVAGIKFLNAVAADPSITRSEKEIADADGILGRAHKQIYVNYVRNAQDAAELASTYASQISEAVACYARHYDPAQPGNFYYHGINEIALRLRAERDGIDLPDSKSPERNPRRMARAMIAALAPQATADAKDPWVLATVAEAHLALGEFDQAARYYGLYARHEAIDAFALAGSIRQLVEVWQLSAGPHGGDAILANLKAALAREENGAVSLSAAETRTISHSESIDYEQHFETRTEGGKFIGFGLLKRIVACGTAVAAIQRSDGQKWRNHGTGFLVRGRSLAKGLAADRSYILTNAHVVWDLALAEAQGHAPERKAITPDKARIVFEDDEIEGRGHTYEVARVVWQSPSRLHDACLIELTTTVGDHIVPLEIARRDHPLESDATGRGSRLAILGHAGGERLALSVLGSIEEATATLVDKGPRAADAAHHDPHYLHYKTPTEGGNSGSPVFEAEDWNVVALHHAGYDQDQGRPKLRGKAGTNFANEGIWIHSIRDGLEAALKAEPAAPAGRPPAGTVAAPESAAGTAALTPAGTPPRRGFFSRLFGPGEAGSRPPPAGRPLRQWSRLRPRAERPRVRGAPDTGEFETAEPVVPPVRLEGRRTWAYKLQDNDVAVVRGCNADVLVMDPHADAMRVLFKPGDVAEMRRRTGAPDKTLLAYMSIGEAEDYRFYWDPQWVRKQGGRTVLTSKAPKWLAAENNEGWSGNFKVRYWDPAWQNVIVGEGMFLDRILAAGFDGVYLDIIDGFEYFADRRTAQDEMVDFVTRICRSARARKPGFLIVPQNGEQLLAKKRYRDVISAIGKEDILYDQRKNSSRHVVDRQPRDYIAGTTEDLKHALADRIPVLSVEYLMDDAANRALIPKVEAEVRGLGYIPYFADRKLAVLHPTRHPPDLAPPAVA